MELTMEKENIEAMRQRFKEYVPVAFHRHVDAIYSLALLGLESRATPSAGEGVREAASMLNILANKAKRNMTSTQEEIEKAWKLARKLTDLATPSATEAKGSEVCGVCGGPRHDGIHHDSRYPGYDGLHTFQPKAPTKTTCVHGYRGWCGICYE